MPGTNIYGQLIRAQLQNSASDLASAVAGLVYYNTTTPGMRYYNGAWRTVANLSEVQTFTGKITHNLTGYISESATISGSTLTPASTPPKAVQRITVGAANLGGVTNTEGALTTQLVLINATATSINIVNDQGSSSSIVTGTGADMALASGASVILLYDATSLRWRVVGGAGSGSGSVEVSALQPLTGTQVVNNFLKKLTPLHTENASAVQRVATYTHGATPVASVAYQGGVYSPTQNRIYLVPFGQGNQTNWHYIDCATGSVVAYAHGVTAVNQAYAGGVYSPTQNRIYLVPYYQGDTGGLWHYIDCATGNVVAYSPGFGGNFNGDPYFVGGVYSPTQNRIYFVPGGQAGELSGQWVYIDCNTGNSVGYNHGVPSFVNGAYQGGVYSPTQNRIYLVPCVQSNQTNWHYIDCATGSVVAYAHGVTAVIIAYQGGVYSPTQNRIYLVPYAQSNQTNWHYIDCATGSVVAYAHGVTAVVQAYSGGVYSPTQNRIYLVPNLQANQTNWHYIDCATGSVVAYTHGVTAIGGAYVGGAYSPTQNRIYLVPCVQSTQTKWHFIASTAQASLAPHYFGSTILSSTL